VDTNRHCQLSGGAADPLGLNSTPTETITPVWPFLHNILCDSSVWRLQGFRRCHLLEDLPLLYFRLFSKRDALVLIRIGRSDVGTYLGIGSVFYFLLTRLSFQQDMRPRHKTMEALEKQRLLEQEIVERKAS